MKEFRKEKRQRVERQKSDAQLLAEDPLADETILAVADTEDIEEIKEVKEEKEECNKCYSYPCSCYHYEYFGGAISFAELDAYLETEAEVEHFESVTWQFKALISNILGNADVGTADKATMISAASEVFKMKLSAREKGAFGKIKEYIADLLGKKENPSEEQNGIEIIVQKDGSKRWFGKYTNNYKDREGEIISEEAHKEFVAYLKQHPDRMPAFWSWHILGTARKSSADYVDYFDGFMIASGPLTTEEADQLEKAIAYDGGKTGMSHGMYILERDPERKEIITKYRDYEISDLPLENAANGITSINSMKEVKMTDEKYNRLVATIGEEAAEKLKSEISDNKEALEALGVESKEDVVAEILDEAEKPAEVVAEEVTEEAEEEKEVDATVKVLAVAVAKAIGMKELSELLTVQAKTIKELQGTVAELKKEDDEKIADQFVDKSLGALLWQKRASESGDTIVSPEDVKEIKEPVSWVTEVM